MEPSETESSDVSPSRLELSETNPYAVATYLGTQFDVPTSVFRSKTSLISVGLAKSTVGRFAAATTDVHDAWDDGDYPLSVSMSQMSMTPVDGHGVSLKLALNTDGTASNRPSLNEVPKQDISIHDRASHNAEIADEKTVGSKHFFDFTWSESSTGESSSKLDDLGMGNLERKKAMTYSSTHLKISPPSFPKPSSSVGANTNTGLVFEWFPDHVLALSNDIRTTIQDKGIVGITSIDIARLDAMLDKFLEDEPEPRAENLHIIIEGRVDKLLEALHDETQYPADKPQIRDVINKARNLQWKWQARFGINYVRIEETRLASLKKVGLHHIKLDQGEMLNGERWRVGTEIPLGYIEVGKWWPSMAYMFRDGVVKGLEEVVYPGPYGLSWVLPMFTGTEEDDPMTGMYRFIREGMEKDMHTKLMMSAGKRVKILRGHTLKSKYAPTHGIRYDGEYLVERYCRLPTQDPKTQKLSLLLKRLETQPSLDELRKIPAPSQVDDFLLCNKIREAGIRTRGGDEACKKWIMDIEKNADEKEKSSENGDSISGQMAEVKNSIIESEIPEKHGHGGMETE